MSIFLFYFFPFLPNNVYNVRNSNLCATYFKNIFMCQNQCLTGSFPVLTTLDATDATEETEGEGALTPGLLLLLLLLLELLLPFMETTEGGAQYWGGRDSGMKKKT